MRNAEQVVHVRAAEDRERLWRAVLAHRERLLRISRGRTPTEQDAEDVVQEAMLRCVEFPGLDEERLAQFLTTVTMRLCADRYRERAHDTRLRHRLSGRDATAPSPEDDVCERDEAAWLARLVDDLPAKQREIVRARQAGMSHAEVAHRLRISYSAVESSMARARLRFRDALVRGAGMVWPVAARWSPTFEAATVTAVIVGGVVVGGLVADGPVPRASARAGVPRVAAPPVRPNPEPRGTPLAQPAPQPVALAPEGVRLTPEPALHGRHPRPTPKPTPVATFGPYTLKPDNDDYPVHERLVHCARYGVQIEELPIRCRYPNEGDT